MKLCSLFSILMLCFFIGEGTASSLAGIIYSGPQNLVVSTAPGSTSRVINFNVNASPDFDFSDVTFAVDPTTGGAELSQRQIVINGGSGNDFVGGFSLERLAAFTDVSSGSSFITGSVNHPLHGSVNGIGGSSDFGPFSDLQVGFIGVRLFNNVDSQLYYGWIQYQAAANSVENPSGVIVDWAFETTGIGIQTAVPEPSALLLVGGLVGLGFVRRRR